jgi:uracil-DNA glycosylase
MRAERQIAGAAGHAEADRAAPVNRLTVPLPDLLERVAPDWLDLVRAWRDSRAGRALIERVEARRVAGASIYPGEPLRALALTPSHALRVVIVGQDPYHRPGQAEGLAFSVPDGQRIPPSLRNVLAEMHRDLGLAPRRRANLAGWAAQGVLLLNTTLTVEGGRPGSHAGWGWEALTDEIVKTASRSEHAVVFMLWGAHAAAKRALIDESGPQRCVMVANHPSPLAARRGPTPFVGCGHFRATNRFLAVHDPGRPPIDWEQ